MPTCLTDLPGRLAYSAFQAGLEEQRAEPFPFLCVGDDVGFVSLDWQARRFIAALAFGPGSEILANGALLWNACGVKLCSGVGAGLGLHY